MAAKKTVIQRKDLKGDPRKQKPPAGSSPTTGKTKLIKRKKGSAKTRKGPAPKTSSTPKRKGIQTKKLGSPKGGKAKSKVAAAAAAKKRRTAKFKKKLKRDDK
jgi:hypothetical protein